jgi:hypothetical protein
MTFLNPAVLIGLIASAIPLVLHFLNLRKLKTIEFSTLAFLKELQKTKIRKIKLKQWLLLLIRIAIILFLVLAFSRPAIKNLSSANSSAAKTSAVIIIDNTFSMSVVTSNGSYLNNAKRIAKNLLNNFHDGDDLNILCVETISNINSPARSNLKQLVNQIDEVEISAVRKTLNEFMIAASQILYQSNNFNKEIYILTDKQKGNIFNSPGEIPNLSSALENNVSLYLIDVSEKEATNLSVVDLLPANQIFEKGKTISFTPVIKNFSNNAINNSVASLFINGKRSAQQSLNLNPGESREINFETTLVDTGLVEASVELEDDDIQQDNKRSIAFYVPDKISILLLSENSFDLKFVKLVLDDPSKKVAIKENSLSTISATDFRKYDAVIIAGGNGNYDYSRLTDYLEHGGSVVLMPGSQNTLTCYQALCGAINISKPLISAGKINSTEFSTQFDKMDFQNPVFNNLFENKKQQKIESPNVFHYYKVNPDKGKNIISLNDGSSFLSEYKVLNGKVFLFSSSLNLAWNDFPVKGFFAPLLYNITLLSASKIKEENSAVTGNEIVADISEKKLPQIIILNPNGVSEIINSDSLTNKKYLSFNKTTVPGVYKFLSAGKLLDYHSVNLDAKESVTDKYERSEFENYLKQSSFEGKFYSLSPSDDLKNIIYQSRFGTELWKYFLIAALTLAILESFIARNSRKELSSIQSAKAGQVSNIKHPASGI